MSWIERIKNNISITTGDGKVYSPQYVIGTKSVDYNVASFNFPHVGGTLVKRSQHQGTKFTLSLIFGGEFNIDDAYDFEISARDPRPWKISHPIYDKMTVQPTGLTIDSTGLNVTKIDVPVLETITGDVLKFTRDPRDKTIQDVTTQQETAAAIFEDVVLDGGLLAQMLDDINVIHDQATDNLAIAQDKADEYTALLNKASSDIADGISSTFVIISSVQDLLMFPFEFFDSVKTKLAFFKKQIETLSGDLPAFSTPEESMVFESMAGTLVLGMVNTAVASQITADYENAVDVVSVIETVLNSYNAYITTLDGLQTANGGEVDSYMPDFESMNEMNSAVNYSVSNLFNIALNAAQERTIFLEDDSNVVTLTHRFYGMDADDTTIDKFMANNNIGISEMLEIKKGRKITYYI